MKLITYLIVSLILLSCSNSPTLSPKKITPPHLNIEKQLVRYKYQIRRCYHPNTPQTITLYLKINKNGNIERITPLPIRGPRIQQCISLILANLRIKNPTKQKYKLKYTFSY